MSRQSGYYILDRCEDVRAQAGQPMARIPGAGTIANVEGALG